MRCTVILLKFLLFSISFGQTGPGGVGNTASNGVWLRADNIDQTDGTPVISWADASGNANDAEQIDPALQPLYFVSSALNSMPIVRFDGGNDEMAVPDAAILDGTTGITFYTVLRPNNLSGAPRGILGKRVTFTDPTNYAYTWFFYTGSRLYLDVHTQNNRFDTGGSTFSNATNYILSWNYDGTLAAGNRSSIRSESNVIVTSTEASTSLPNSNRDLALGALNTGYGTYLGADYAEVIHFNYALDAVDHIMVQDYLSAKYNIALSSEDYYDEDDPGNGDYDFDVAGIGQISATVFNDDAQGSGIVRISNPRDLNDDEFFIWGHDGGTQQAIESTDVPASLDARFERVWRVSEVNSSLTAVDVGGIDISFDLTGLGSVTTTDLRLLIDTDNDGNFNDETPIAGATDLGGDIYQFANLTGITNNLRFTLGTINSIQTPLPIELMHFQAKAIDNEFVELKWLTASETNNDYFTVQRSKDGINWIDLFEVDGAGNSSTLIDYLELDRDPIIGQSYYRLKQTDYDGAFEYSNSQSVFIEINSQEILVYPNPTNDQITIIGSEQELSEIRLFNTLGQEITSQVFIEFSNPEMAHIELIDLAPGIFHLKTKTLAEKVIKN